MKLFGYVFVGMFGLAAVGALIYMTFASHEVVVESSEVEFGLGALGEDVTRSR